MHSITSVKREKFHIAIRKSERESVFSKKRRVQKLGSESQLVQIPSIPEVIERFYLFFTTSDMVHLEEAIKLIDMVPEGIICYIN